MMKKVRETLAGRIGILDLYSLSAREKAGLVFDTDLDFSLATLQARQRKLPKNDVIQVFHHIWEGGMPQVQGVDDELKRLSKTPKLYFCDTGLCVYLSMWLTPDTLRHGAASGHYYENYVVMELVKNYAYAKSKVNLTYFRDSNAQEIDVFVEENNVIHPLEIKKSAAPDRREVKKYSIIDKASLKRGNGGIICMCEEPIPIDADNCFIPSNLI